MKKTLYVARNELYSLFYSPIAWVMMIIFFVMTSADYISTLSWFTSYWEWGASQLVMVKAVTGGIFSHIALGVFPKMARNLYIFLPLITMGLVSREMSSGSIKLLQSSPVRTRQIVLGKFLAMAAFIGVLMGLVLILVLACSLSIVHPDLPHVLLSMVGLTLILLAYSAIGLFISSLTAYQIVAALLTMALFMYFKAAAGIGLHITWIRNLNYYLYMSGKGQLLIDTLFSLRDVTYFMVIIGGFLAFTVIRIKSSSESIHWVRKAARYALVILIGFVLAWITSNPWVNFYYDGTNNKRFTITPHTQELLAKMNQGGLEITGYINLLDGGYNYYRPEHQNDEWTMFFEKYVRFKPDIHINYKYYYAGDPTIDRGFVGLTLDQVADTVARLNHMDIHQFMNEKEVSKQLDVVKQEYHSVFELTYQGKSTILHTFTSPEYANEDEMAASLKRLITTVPKIDFLADEIERSPFLHRNGDCSRVTFGYPNHETLVSEGYDIDTISLNNRSAVPDSLAALVIADPRVPFSKGSLDKISQYIDNGGNLLITCEPDRKEVIQPVLDKLGVSFHEGQLLQRDPVFSAEKIKPFLTDTAKQFAPREARFFKEEVLYSGTTDFPLMMAGASGLRYVEKDGFKVDELVFTDSSKSWNRTAPINPDSLFLPPTNLASDEHGRFPTSLRLSRRIHGREQRIIVSGDADYLSDRDFFTEGNYRYDFWSFSLFSNGQFPANTLLADTPDNGMKVFQRDIPRQRIILYWIIPAIIAVMGMVILLRRNRK